MPLLPTNGIRMHYEERGSGDPLIMIMGITAPGAVWEAHADDWSNSFRCIMPDNRGVGDTDKPAGDYSSEMFADDYAGLMDALSIEKARIVGVSMGSIIAQQLCLRHPERVQSAVLMCPWARCDRYAKSVFKHMGDCKARLSPAEFMEWIQLLIFTKPFWDNDEAYQSLLDGRNGATAAENPQPLHGSQESGRGLHQPRRLRSTGQHPAPLPRHRRQRRHFHPSLDGRRGCQPIPNCESHFYDNAGHAFHWEAMEDFNPRVREWLQAH